MILNYSVTLTRYGLLPDDDLLRSKHVGVPLNIFMYFNIEINILDLYSVECEKVHVLVFINY